MRLNVGLGLSSLTLIISCLSVANVKAQERELSGDTRFKMTQSGQKMTSEDFARWMAERGIRIVGRQAEPSTMRAPVVSASAIPPQTPATTPYPLATNKQQEPLPAMIVEQRDEFVGATVRDIPEEH